jgi:serine/threonine protein kinase
MAELRSEADKRSSETSSDTQSMVAPLEPHYDDSLGPSDLRPEEKEKEKEKTPRSEHRRREERRGSEERRGPLVGNVLEARYRYRLVRRLGKGGFGSVFLADSIDASPLDPDAPPPQVAIKVIGTTTDLQARSSIKRELAALLAIRHDRIPKLYDWRLDGEHAFVAMQYYPAGSLADAWPFIGRFDEEQTCSPH